jgi:hypothetical protein
MSAPGSQDRFNEQSSIPTRAKAQDKKLRFTTATAWPHPTENPAIAE